MPSREHKAHALILRSVDYGDTDRILTLLLSPGGKTSAIAKGGKVSKKRFAGALELFRISAVSFRESRSGSLAFLNEARVVEDFRHIETSFDKIAFGSYATELTRELIQEGDDDPNIMALLIAYYRKLNTQDEEPRQLELHFLAFISHLLTRTGFGPSLKNCISCGRHALDGQELLYSLLGEGILCAGCRAPGQQTIETSSQTVSLMISCLDLNADSLDALIPPDPTLHQARRLILRTAHIALERELRSFKTLQLVFS